MSDNYNDRDELAKRMGFDSWDAYLNSGNIPYISEEEAKDKFFSRQIAFSESTNELNLTKDELERLNNFRSKHNFRSKLPKFKIGINNWSFLDDKENAEEIINHYISINNLEGKSIIKEDFDFYQAVHRRGLKDLLPKAETKWSWLDNEEHLEENIQNYISENNLEGKSIWSEDHNFYAAVHRRGLLDLLPKLPNGNAKWLWLNKEENLEENIKNYISENNLEGKWILQEDPSFYKAIEKRGLTDLLYKIKKEYNSSNQELKEE